MDIKRIISVGVIAVVLAACASAQQSNIGGAAAKLQGDGAAITDLNASNLTTGTVAAERLPATVATTAAGTFTCTYTGFASALTAPCYYWITGKIAHVMINGSFGGSNSASFTVTGIPVAAHPATNGGASQAIRCMNEGVVGNCKLTWQAGSGTLLIGNGNNSVNGFTASGNKGFDYTLMLSWPIN